MMVIIPLVILGALIVLWILLIVLVIPSGNWSAIKQTRIFTRTPSALTSSSITLPGGVLHDGTTSCQCGCMNYGPFPARNKEANPNVDNLPLRDDLIIGWRSYDVQWENGRPVLAGARGAIWRERKLVAVCGKEDASSKDPATRCERHLATLTCSCGIYAYSDKNAVKDLPVGGWAVARVVMYGVVWPHSGGWRASECRIESLEYNPVGSAPVPLELELCAKLSQLYEVPCDVASSIPEPRSPNRGGPSIWNAWTPS